MGKFDWTMSSVRDAHDVLDALQKDARLRQSAKARGIPARFPFGVWFRGHESSSYKLNPKVFRPRERSDRSRWLDSPFPDETNFVVHSRVRLPEYQQSYRSMFDWLCLMQHYEIPTRLLDWTESFLIALYFAVRDCALVQGTPKPLRDGEVVVLDARRLCKVVKNSYSLSNPESSDVKIRAEMAHVRIRSRLLERNPLPDRIPEESLASPVAVFPNRSNPRMTFQSSVFTLHGGKLYHRVEPVPVEDRMPQPKSLEEIDQEHSILRYIRIPARRKPKIADELFRLGIHEGSLFPEIDKQARYLEALW